MKPDEKIKKVEITKIIKVQLIQGTGTKENPVRQVNQYWDLDGKLIYVEDSLSTSEINEKNTNKSNLSVSPGLISDFHCIDEKSLEDLAKEFIKYANRHNECHLGLTEKTESCQSCLKKEQCNEKSTEDERIYDINDLKCWLINCICRKKYFEFNDLDIEIIRTLFR